MSRAVLIAYATRYGSTKEVAQFIGKKLEAKGLKVDTQSCNQIESLENYDFILLGTPYYIGSMLKKAKNFIKIHQSELSKKPFAIFALGPIGEDEKGKSDASDQMDKELQQFTWLQPVSTIMFGGKYDPKKLRFLDKLLTIPPASPLHNLAANDARNWDNIKAWAEKLSSTLLSTENPSVP